jgi:hypothetical protein
MGVSRCRCSSTGQFAPIDLAPKFALGQAAPLAHVGEPVGATWEMSRDVPRSTFLAPDRRGVLVADVVPAHRAQRGCLLFGGTANGI